MDTFFYLISAVLSSIFLLIIIPDYVARGINVRRRNKDKKLLLHIMLYVVYSVVLIAITQISYNKVHNTSDMIGFPVIAISIFFVLELILSTGGDERVIEKLLSNDKKKFYAMITLLSLIFMVLGILFE